MSQLSDDDDVLVDGGMEPESPMGDAPARDESDDDDGDEAVGFGGATGGERVIHAPRGVRPISDKTRELFKAAAKKIADARATGGESDDEYDVANADGMESAYGDQAAPAAGSHPPDAKSSTTGQTASKAQQPALSPPPPAPALDPEVGKLREQLSAKLTELESREKALEQRESSGDHARLRDTYFERGAPAIVELVKQWTGLEGDELKAEITDLVSDLSGQELGVALPDSIRTKIEAKRARQAVKALKLEQVNRDKAEQQRAEKARESDQKNRAIMLLGKEIAKPDVAQQYPYLMAEEGPGELVFEVIEAQLKKDGTMLQWTDAAKRANDYLKSQASAWFDKRKHLLSAAPASAGDASKPKQDGTQGRPQQGIAGQKPPPKPETSAAPAPMRNGKWDIEAHRRQTKQRMRAAFARQSSED